MRSKVVAAEMATAAGIPAAIVNGLRARRARRACWAARPTRARTSRRATSGSPRFKLWLRYAKPAHGTVVVDAGAARALRDGGTSLLPVGVVDVIGSFAAGDAVEIAATADRRTASWARASPTCRAAELRRVQGMQSPAAREVLPRAAEEAVHRDYFVLA